MLVFVLALMLPQTAGAVTWKPEAEQFSHFELTLPEGYRLITEETPLDDPVWTDLAIENPTEVRNAFSQDADKGGMNAVAVIYSPDGSAQYFVQCKVSEESAKIHNFGEASQEEQQAFLDQFTQVDEEAAAEQDFTIQAELYDQGEQMFFHLTLDGTVAEQAADNGLPNPNDDSGKEIHEQIYGTILNGYLLAIDTYEVGGEISPEAAGALQEITNSIRITARYGKEEWAEMNKLSMDDLLAPILMVLILVVMIVGAVVASRIIGKRDKEKKRVMAERISAFHQEHKNNVAEGILCFVNMTDCNQEAVHKFSIYHAYIKNLAGFVVGFTMGLLLLVVTLLTEGGWVMILISLAVLIYYVYKLFTASTTVERVQRKIYGAGTTTKAKYFFYDNMFRVSGIQASMIYPYFHISSVRETKEYLYLYYGPDNAYILSKEGFTTGEVRAFLDFMRKKRTENE